MTFQVSRLSQFAVSQPPSANDRFFALRLGEEPIELRALKLIEVGALGEEWDWFFLLVSDTFGIPRFDGSVEHARSFNILGRSFGPDLLANALPQFANVTGLQVRGLSWAMQIKLARAIAKLTIDEHGERAVLQAFNRGLAKGSPNPQE